MIETQFRKRVCLFNGDWDDFEVIELVYEKPRHIGSKKVQTRQTRKSVSTEATSELFNPSRKLIPQSPTNDTGIMCLKRRASLFFIISLFAFSIVLLLGISLGTEYWIEAGVQRDLRALNSSNRQLPLKSFLGANPIDGSDPGAFLGIVKFGLFSGCKRFNYGLGVRDPTCFSVFAEHENVYNLSIVITVIVFILGAIAFGLVATVFGLVNTLTVPIETIHGPAGLYVWNGVGAILSFIAWILYLSLYHTEIKYNVLNEKDTGSPTFFQTDKVQFGYSYWLLIMGFILFLLNIFFVFLAQCVQDPKFLWRKKKENDTNRNDVGLDIMY